MKIRAILVAALLGSSALLAQETVPTFRTGTTLVEFTFVALDEKGNPVTDLSREDISVSEDGRSRDIAFFHFDGSQVATPRPPLPLARGEFSNRPEFATNPPRNITAIVLDTLNTGAGDVFPLEDQVVVRARILQYLRTIEPGTRVALYRMGSSGVIVVHDFTDDVDALRTSIANGSLEVQLQKNIEPVEREATDNDRVKLSVDRMNHPEQTTPGLREDLKRPEYFYREQVFQRTVQRTLAGLDALGDHLAAIPGRKNLVWVSTGTAMAMHFDGWLSTYEKTLRETARRLATKGIVMYPFDAKGPNPFNGRGFWESMELFATVTGGRTIKNADDPTLAMAAAANDLRGSYAVGFYVADEAAGKWHALKVSAKRRDVQIRHQQGYLSGGRDEQVTAWNEAQWRSALMNPLGSTAVALSARISAVSSAGAGTYDLQLRIASENLQFREANGALGANIDLVTAEKTATGDLSFRVESAALKLPLTKTALPPTRITHRLHVKPTTSSLRLIVRDRNTGRYGVLDVELRTRN